MDVQTCDDCDCTSARTRTTIIAYLLHGPERCYICPRSRMQLFYFFKWNFVPLIFDKNNGKCGESAKRNRSLLLAIVEMFNYSDIIEIRSTS